MEAGGATFLLLPDRQKAKLSVQTNERYKSPMLALAFSSLSPIHFASEESLNRKLLTYNVPKDKSKGVVRSLKQGHPVSTANPPEYFISTGSSQRSYFEHNRLLWHLCLDEIEPRTFSLPNRHLSNHVRLIALAANCLAGSVLNPLDVAWGAITVKRSDERLEFDRVDIGHFLINRSLSPDGRAFAEFVGGKTLREPLDVVAKSLQMALEPDQDESVIVICCDFEKQLEPLLNTQFGVKTNGWQKSLEPLIGWDHVKRQMKVPQQERSRPQTKDPRRREYIDIKREASPVRGEDRYHDHWVKQEGRSRSSSPTPDYSCVYVVDLLELYWLLGMRSPDKTVAGLAQKLQLNHLLPEGWCAGNECSVLFDAWRSLVSGPPIDERKAIACLQTINMESVVINGDSEEAQGNQEAAPLNFNALLTTAEHPEPPSNVTREPMGNFSSHMYDDDDSGEDDSD